MKDEEKDILLKGLDQLEIRLLSLQKLSQKVMAAIGKPDSVTEEWGKDYQDLMELSEVVTKDLEALVMNVYNGNDAELEKALAKVQLSRRMRESMSASVGILCKDVKLVTDESIPIAEPTDKEFKEMEALMVEKGYEKSAGKL